MIKRYYQLPDGTQKAQTIGVAPIDAQLIKVEMSYEWWLPKTDNRWFMNRNWLVTLKEPAATRLGFKIDKFLTPKSKEPRPFPMENKPSKFWVTHELEPSEEDKVYALNVDGVLQFFNAQLQEISKDTVYTILEERKSAEAA